MTTIWDSTATTPAATHRVPVDRSSSSSPAHWTGQQIADVRAYIGETVNSLGPINTNQSLSLADGRYIAATITGNVQFTFTSVPTGATDLFLELTDAGAYTITFAASLTWTGGTAPTLPTSGVALLHLRTRNGGTTYLASMVSDEQEFAASAITSGTLATARLGSGTANSGTFLRGDQTWAAISATGPTGPTGPAGPTGATGATGATGPIGGSTTQPLWNNAGVCDGMAGTAWDNLNRSLTMTGATVTTSAPVLNLSQTWNNAAVTFYGMAFNVTNTASASGSLLAYWQVPATYSGCAMRPDGRFLSYSGTAPSSGTSFGQSGGTSFLVTVGITNILAVSTGGALLPVTSVYGWSSTSSADGIGDLYIRRDAAGTLAQRDGTNAQTMRVYRSYTDASNYSRWTVEWNTSTAILHAEGAGTGTDGSVAFNDAALATDATRGFLMIPSCAGTPTGTPADIPTGQAPIVYDSTNKKLCVWDGAAWVQTAALT